MVAVLTGDVVGSRDVDRPELWLDPLKQYFNTLGASPCDWDIYRGDSFQLRIEPSKALGAALRIKAIIMQHEPLNVRIAIGLGEEGYESGRISESNGQVYLYSGETLDALKSERRTLKIKSFSLEFDAEWNMILMMAMLVADEWSAVSAATVTRVLESPGISQTALAKEWGISQSSVSERINRAHTDEILQLINFYESRIENLISTL